MIMDLRELSTELQKKRSGKRVVMITGVFDMFHYDHLKCIERAKKLGDILIVAVKNNTCARLKGENRPIIDEQQRIAIVDALKYVDYTILVDYKPEAVTVEADNNAQNDWLAMFEYVFKELKPDIFSYEDVPKLETARLRILEKYYISGAKRERGEKSSTTDIIKKIKNS